MHATPRSQSDPRHDRLTSPSDHAQQGSPTSTHARAAASASSISMPAARPGSRQAPDLTNISTKPTALPSRTSSPPAPPASASCAAASQPGMSAVGELDQNPAPRQQEQGPAALSGRSSPGLPAPATPVNFDSDSYSPLPAAPNGTPPQATTPFGGNSPFARGGCRWPLAPVCD